MIEPNIIIDDLEEPEIRNVKPEIKTNPMLTPMIGSKEMSRQSMELRNLQKSNKESIDKLQIKLKNEFLDKDESLFTDPSKYKKPIK